MRGPTFRAGTVVQWHPDANPGMDNHTINDRGTVLRSEPAEEMPHLVVVWVLWDSRVSELTERQLDRPCSTYAMPVMSTRLRRLFRGADLMAA